MTERGFAVVTGASKGIGAELAAQLAGRGWNLILVARGKGELEALAGRLIAKHGIKAVALETDLSRPGASADLWGRVGALGASVEVLINNAGFGLLGPFHETPIGRELEMIQVNITALTELTKLALPPMLERRKGWILNVGSTAGFVPGPLMSIYYASKAYVLSFSEALVSELAGSGVSVTVLCPGPTRTQFSATARSSNSKLFTSAKPMEAPPVARAGLDGLFKGKAIVLPGLKNKLMVQTLRIAPRWAVRKIVRGMQETQR